MMASRSACQFWGKVNAFNNLFYASCIRDHTFKGLRSVKKACLVPNTAYTSSPAHGNREDYKLVYTAPLKGAVRAVKVFSICTAASATVGGPVLVVLGNPEIPLAGRVALSSIVVLVGLSTTAILHWLTKGYVMKMLYHPNTHHVAAFTLSVIARLKRNEFHLSESGPPASTAGFSTFQARGKSYFLHTDMFEDQKLLGHIIGGFNDAPRQDTDI